VHQENYVENNMQTNKFGRPNKLHDSWLHLTCS
jgi:hypothetical protein